MRHLNRLLNYAMPWLLLVVMGCGDKSPVNVPLTDGAKGASGKSPAPEQPSGNSMCCVLDEPARSPACRTTETGVAELRNRSVEELAQAGERAAPLLLAAMEDPQAAERVISTLWFRQEKGPWMIPILVAGLHCPNANTCVSAVSQLAAFGPRVRIAAPNIAQDLEPLCDAYGDEVLNLIDKIGLPVEEASALLCKLHATGSSFAGGPGHARFSKGTIVTKVLSNGTKGVPTLLDLVANMKSNDERDFTLPNCGREVIDAIVGALDDPEVKHRRAAAWLLTRQAAVQPRAFTEEQLTAILPRLDDQDKFVREYLFEVLERQSPQSAEAVVVLVAKLRDANHAEVHRAAHALAKMAPQSLVALRAAAHSDHTQVRLAATVAIGSLKPIPAEDVLLLVRMAADSEVVIRQYAIYGLQQSGSKTPDVMHCFANALKDSETAYWAARALGEMGPAASPALPSLAERLKEAEPGYRVCLAMAIWKIEPTSPVVIPALLEVLKDTETPREGYACVTKMVDGKRIEVRIPLEEPVAVVAAQAFGKMGPAAAPAVPALVKALDSENSDLANSAVRALGSIGPAARAAIDPLCKLAASEDPRNAEAHFALQQIAPDAAAKISTTGHSTHVFRVAPVQASR